MGLWFVIYYALYTIHHYTYDNMLIYDVAFTIYNVTLMHDTIRYHLISASGLKYDRIEWPPDEWVCRNYNLYMSYDD